MGEKDTEADASSGGAPKEEGPLAYRLVVIAILSVSVLFIVVMVFFGWQGIFDNAAQVVAALTSAFAVIGTLVGAYFGIKSSNDGREAVQAVHTETTGALSQAANATEKAADKAATAAAATREATHATEKAADKAATAAAATQEATHATKQATSTAQQLTETAQQLVNGQQEQTPPNETASNQ
jgi:cytoskeletal protein RodZ